ncbi:hypothetical protein BSZ39_00965 [Bowdeniella nasicola]|uniref:Phosphatidate phosphatase APP1 catalytic domain-containing protein n=1 Tax=Bowdeniella nasicola TaxID=208480 RepID=A0A1Q5Q5J8_9ACTO|nr:phosphatase domain-containing protein [Bowdeniella nasicola]OKL54982.1 hypothetical protein BSZ39_00965 [Bowdeniella nasicola]
MGFSRTGSLLEDAIHARVEPAVRALGFRPRVIGYLGYGTTDAARVLARVLLSRPSRSAPNLPAPIDKASRGWRNFMTVHAADLPVKIQVGDALVTAHTNRNGYLDVEFTGHGLPPGRHSAYLQTPEGKVSRADVEIIGDDQRIGLVSDIDDTILITMLPRPLLAFWNSFVRHTSTRKPVPHMAELYTAMRVRRPDLPVFYLSTGAWNTFSVLRRFLAKNGFPDGPLLLTDWGPTQTGWFRSGQEHKRTMLRRLRTRFPHVKWILIGDDGQHDPQIYGEFAAEFPDDVLLIGIRQLTAAQQVLAHGTPDTGPGDRSHPEVCEDEMSAPVDVVTGPDGRALATQILPVLEEHSRPVS